MNASSCSWSPRPQSLSCLPKANTWEHLSLWFLSCLSGCAQRSLISLLVESFPITFLGTSSLHPSLMAFQLLASPGCLLGSTSFCPLQGSRWNHCGCGLWPLSCIQSSFYLGIGEGGFSSLRLKMVTEIVLYCAGMCIYSAQMNLFLCSGFVSKRPLLSCLWLITCQTPKGDEGGIENTIAEVTQLAELPYCSRPETTPT